VIEAGVWRTAELYARGMTKRDIAASCSVGVLIRIRRGVYRGRSAPAEVVLAAEHGGALACASALRHHGIWTFERDRRAHVWLGEHGSSHTHAGCRCVSHWDGQGAGFGVVPLIDALIQAADCLGQEAFLAAFESAWKQARISASDRRRIRSALSARHRWLVDIARDDADSGLESIVRLRLIRLGIRVACQVRIRHVGRVDFVLAGRVILEVDGKENHDGPSERHKDLRRDAIAISLGFTPLRFDYSLVMYEWPIVERAVLAALSRPQGLR
jgi:very-short-patch-repair endonuclease